MPLLISMVTLLRNEKGSDINLTLFFDDGLTEPGDLVMGMLFSPAGRLFFVFEADHSLACDASTNETGCAYYSRWI